jgi:hypothetical protein
MESEWSDSCAGCFTARVFSRDRPLKVAHLTGRPIRDSWWVLWLVIRLLSVRADVSSSVRSILPCTERLYCIPLHTCQHAGALPATTNTSPTPRHRTVRTKYYYCTHKKGARLNLHFIEEAGWVTETVGNYCRKQKSLTLSGFSREVQGFRNMTLACRRYKLVGIFPANPAETFFLNGVAAP